MPELEPIRATPAQPLRRAVMRQTWQDLTFLHWPCSPVLVRPLVPRELHLDLFGGSAWIGLVPFRIVGLTLPHAPSVPRLSHFPETNVRTYVADGEGRRGVWFFSLDAARLAAVIGARSFFALPYYWARMSVERGPSTVRYRSERIAGPRAFGDDRGPPAGAEIEIRPGAAIAAPDELELFLTARFHLYACRQSQKKIVRADVEHPPWPLQRAEVGVLRETLVRAAGLPVPEGPPLAHFAARLEVRVAAPVTER